MLVGPGFAKLTCRHVVSACFGGKRGLGFRVFCLGRARHDLSRIGAASGKCFRSLLTLP